MSTLDLHSTIPVRRWAPTLSCLSACRYSPGSYIYIYPGDSTWLLKWENGRLKGKVHLILIYTLLELSPFGPSPHTAFNGLEGPLHPPPSTQQSPLSNRQQTFNRANGPSLRRTRCLIIHQQIWQRPQPRHLQQFLFLSPQWYLSLESKCINFLCILYNVNTCVCVDIWTFNRSIVVYLKVVYIHLYRLSPQKSCKDF